MDLDLVNFAFATLDLAIPPKLSLLEAGTLKSAHVPPFPPEMPALLTGINSRQLASSLKDMLMTVYPNEHRLRVVHGENAYDLALNDLASFDVFSQAVCVYVPPLEEGCSLESLAEVVARLRAPDGCPWDRQQTHTSLRTHLLEESYEALAAVDANDFESMCEEFGDLLLQIVLHAQIAAEEGRFSLTRITKGIYDKIIRRHPHVFGELRLSGVEGVLQNWEKLKEHERREQGGGSKGLLAGIPVALPALSQAQEHQERAARVGFDWPELEGVLDKIREEIDELRHATDAEEVTAEMGDLFFALVNLARWKKVDAESALREAISRFRTRFSFVESAALEKKQLLSDMAPDELDALWEQAKQHGEP